MTDIRTPNPLVDIISSTPPERTPGMSQQPQQSGLPADSSDAELNQAPGEESHLRPQVLKSDDEHDFGLEPMTVGRIVDHSLRLAPKLFFSLVLLVIIVSMLRGIEMMAAVGSFSNPKYQVLFRCISIAGKYLGAMLHILAILFAAQLWRGERTNLAAARPQIKFGRIFSGGFLSLRIGFVTMFGLMLFVLPGLIYFLNRMLAYPILYLENASRGAAIKRSCFLMQQEKWFRKGSPVARLSLLLGIQLFTTGVTSFVLIASPIWVQRAGAGIAFQGLATIGGTAIVHFLSMFATLSLVGFYFDLRSRYEGEDLLQMLES